MKHEPFVAVIGGITMDILAFPSGRLVRGDSSPGRVTFSPGGVGRNIAETLSRLSVPVSLFSVVGDDADGKALSSLCRDQGMEASGLRVIPGADTCAYIAIHDEGGETEAAIAAMDICASITPSLVDEWAEAIDRASCIVIDANLPAETMEYAARRFSRIPIVLDPVSETKAARTLGALPFLRAVKPNREEAGILCGFPVQGPEDLERASAALHGRGIHWVFISLGADGVYCSDSAGEAGFFPAPEVGIADTTGAGDAFTAGIAYGVFHGLDLAETARVSLALAALAMETGSAVNPCLSGARLAEFLAIKQIVK
jgi:pseudouridine kinase